MPKFVGKVSTTDADGVAVYGDAVQISKDDPSKLSERIPQVYYSFDTSRAKLYKTYDNMQNDIFVSAKDIPYQTIIYMQSEGNAYIRLAEAGGVVNWQLLSSMDSKIFYTKAEAEAYASTVGKVGEIITVVDSEEDEVIVYKITFGNILTDVATSFLVQLYAVTDPYVTIASGQSFAVGFTYNEKYGTDSTGRPGYVTYQIKRPTDLGFVTITSIAGDLPTTIEPTPEGSETPNVIYFDPTRYGYALGTGENTIRITVAGGESRKTKSIDFVINVVSLSVVPNATFNDNKVKTQTVLQYGWRCYGAGVDKSVYTFITDDATGIRKQVGEPILLDKNVSGVDKFTNIDIKTIFGKANDNACHGTYTIEQYAEITGSEIRSETISVNVMVCPGTNPVPLVSASANSYKVNYGDTITIKYGVYTYSSSVDYTNILIRNIFYYSVVEADGEGKYPEGSLVVVSDDKTPGANEIRLKDVHTTTDESSGNIISVGDHVLKTIYFTNESNFINNSDKITWNITDYPDTSVASAVMVEFTCTNTVSETDAEGKITETEYVGSKILVIELDEISGDFDIGFPPKQPFVYFTARGRGNNDANRDLWESTVDGTDSSAKVKLVASLSNLNFVNNGWVQDSEGAACLRLSGSAKCNVPIIMNDDKLTDIDDVAMDVQSIRASGRTIIIDLNIHDVIDPDAECINWYSSVDNRGIKVTPQAAYLLSDYYKLVYGPGGVVTNKDTIPFVQMKDSKRIQIAIVIEHEGMYDKTANCVDPTNESAVATQYIRMYMNGELSKAISFSKETWAFHQNKYVHMSIGSTDAITDIYSIRYYDMALTDADIVQNYIAERATIKDRIDEYNKNNIYDTVDTINNTTPVSSSGTYISYELAKRVYPCMLVTGILSPVKGTKTKVGLLFTKPDKEEANGYKIDINCMDYYTVEGGSADDRKYLCETNVQGTSSQIYAKKNYKFKFAKLNSKVYGDMYTYSGRTNANSDWLYCNFVEFPFNSWYGPNPDGDNDYWRRLSPTSQQDTYNTYSVYKIDDKVFYNGYQYICIQDINCMGYGIQNTPSSYVFIPSELAAVADNYVVHNTSPAPEGMGAEEWANASWYFIPAGGQFYYKSPEDNTLLDYSAGSVPAEDPNDIPASAKIFRTKTYITNDNGSHSVHIGANDEIETSKVKYYLYPKDGDQANGGEDYRGAAESTVCFKADYMSPDGINSDNGRMFPKLFEELVPPQSQYNPYAGENKNVFISIPGFRCLLFRRDTEASTPIFWGRYNFNYDKGSTKSFGLENDGDEDDIGITNETCCQKWEYLDNKDDICNFKDYRFFKPMNNGSIAALSALESTYPDQGDLEDVGRTPNYIPLQIMYSWVLQRANYWDASDTILAVPFLYNGVNYYSEKDYRRAIFKNEFEKHFNKNHVITYSICVETMAIVDNMAKNMFMTCYDIYHDTNMYKNLLKNGAQKTAALAQSAVNIKFKSSAIGSFEDLIDKNTGNIDADLVDWENSVFQIWYTSLYDMDSCGGCDNTGHNIYNYDIELDEIYAYDSDGNPTYCFNGATSTFWLMVRDTYADDIKAQYIKLRDAVNTKLSYDILYNEYIINGAETIPPVVYNEDQRYKYLDIYTDGFITIDGKPTFDSSYQYLCQGSKKYHKQWFLENRLKFLDSKYMIPAYTSSDSNFSFRVGIGGNTSVTAEDVSLDITVATTQYQRVAYGNTDEGNMPGGKCKAGETIHIVPYAGGVYQDIVLLIFGSSNVSDIGDISRFYPYQLKLPNARCLKRLIVGSSKAGYVNDRLDNISLNGAPLLQVLDLTNVTGLTSQLNLETNVQLQEVYLGGTNIPIVVFPNGGTLKRIKLPKTLTALTLRNQNYVESIEFEGTDNIQNLIVENSSGSGLDVPEIIMNCQSLRRARLTGVNWSLDDKEVLNKLMTCTGYNASGGETSKCILTGSVYVRSASKVNLEVWEEYWADAIADGSLTINVAESPDFYCVTYCNPVNTQYAGYDDIKSQLFTNGVEDEGYWYFELASHDVNKDGKLVSMEDERFTGFILPKSKYRPTFINNNGGFTPLVKPDGKTERFITTEAFVRTNGAQAYWEVDDRIETISPNNGVQVAIAKVTVDGDLSYDINDVANRRYLTYNELENMSSYKSISDDSKSLADHKSTSTEPVVVKLCDTYNTWIVGANADVSTSSLVYRPVLMDDQDNIVYTARSTLYKIDGSNTWYDVNPDDGLTINLPYDTTTHRSALVKAVELISDFVDGGDKSQYRLSEYPLSSMASPQYRFSNWSPTEYNIEENKYVYARYVQGDINPIPASSFFTFDIFEGTAEAIESYVVTDIATGVNSYLGSIGSTSLVIPKEYNGIPIRAIGNGQKCVFTSTLTEAYQNVRKLFFETGSEIKHIAANAFAGCTAFELIEIPETVTYIGDSAFANMSAEIYWSGSSTMKTLNVGAFRNYGTNENFGSMNVAEKATVIISGKNTTFPDSIEVIDSNAFNGSYLNLTFGNNSSLHTIKPNAFATSFGSNYRLPESLLRIESGAFNGNGNIVNIELPNSLLYLGDSAFAGCVNLETVGCSNCSLTYIANGPTVFIGTKLYNNSGDAVILTERVTDRHEYLVCIKNTALTSYTVNANTVLIAENAFSTVKDTLTSLTFTATDGKLEYINASAFENCVNVTSAIALPVSLLEIADKAFKGCAKLAAVDLSGVSGTPTRLKSIGAEAFADCVAMTDFDMTYSNIETIAHRAFCNTGLTSIKLPITGTLIDIADFVFNKSNSIVNVNIPYIGRTPTSRNSIDSVFGWLFGYQINPETIEIGHNLKGRQLYVDLAKLNEEGVIPSDESSTTIFECTANIGSSESPKIIPTMTATITKDGITIKSLMTLVENNWGTDIVIPVDAVSNIINLPSNISYTVTSVSSDERYKDIFVYNKDYITVKNDTDNITPTVQRYGDGEDDYEEYYIPNTLSSVNVTLSETINRGAFYNCATIDTIVLNPNVATIEPYAFYNCHGLTAIDLTALTKLATIDDFAFANCDSLTSIEMSPSVTAQTYGDSVFANCSALTTLKLGNTLVSIGVNCFDNINQAALYSDENIRYVKSTGDNTHLIAISVIDPTLTANINASTICIYDECFKNYALETITIPQNVSIINENVFIGCNNLRGITVTTGNTRFKAIVHTSDGGVTNASVGQAGILVSSDGSELICLPVQYESGLSSAFKITDVRNIRSHACENVTKSYYQFAEPLEKVGDNAFTGSTALTYANFGSTTRITDGMFKGCSNAQLVFDGAITYLGKSAFEGCAEFRHPVLSGVVTEIPDKCFYGCTKLLAESNFEIPKSVVTFGEQCFYGVTSDSNLVLLELNEPIITTIGRYAFENLRVKKFNIPETVSSIGEGAFKSSTLTDINLNKVTTVGKSAFENCENLISVNIPNGCSLNDRAFYGCKELKTVNMIGAGSAPTISSANPLDVFAWNHVHRLFVVPNGRYESFKEANNWAMYYPIIVEQDDYENGITRITYSASVNSNPSIQITKYAQEETTDEGDKEFTSELTTVLWGDRMWTGPGNSVFWRKLGNFTDFTISEDTVTYLEKNKQNSNAVTYTGDNAAKIIECLNGIVNYDISKADEYVTGDVVCYWPTTTTNTSYLVLYQRTSESFDDFSEVDISQPMMSWTGLAHNGLTGYTNANMVKASYTNRNYYDSGIDYKTNLLCNSAYVSRTTYNTSGAASTSSAEIGYPTAEKYEILMINRHKWKPNGYILGSTANNTRLADVSLDNRITSLDTPNTFYNATALVNVVLPTGDYDKIGTNYFRCCTSLEYVQLPKTLRYISDRCFSDCVKLSGINLNDIISVGVEAFYDCNALKQIEFEKIENIGNSSFRHCDNLERVIIHVDEIPEIGYNPFTTNS